jgi:hypothetical protein
MKKPRIRPAFGWGMLCKEDGRLFRGLIGKKITGTIAVVLLPLSDYRRLKRIERAAREAVGECCLNYTLDELKEALK